VTRPHTRQAVVVGAGIVGLSVAWFLQEEGLQVTVVDRNGVAAGASAGNAGWICPGFATPLPEPSVLKYAFRSLVQRDSPLRVAPAALPSTAAFFARFALSCSGRAWRRGVAGMARLGALAQECYDLLQKGGVSGELVAAPMLMAFASRPEAAPVWHELHALAAAGQGYPVTELGETALRDALPLLSARAGYGLRLEGQRYLQPLDYTRRLGQSVQERGGTIRGSAAVTRVGPASGGRVRITTVDGTQTFDAAVLANGAWLGTLAKEAGVRVPVAGGRGYSFTVSTATPPPAPWYLPKLRVVGTPTPGGMRVGGTMEFTSVDAPLDMRRIDAIVRSARDYLTGVDWSTMANLWVGPRPVSADGLPLIGATRHENLFIAGGHGMWGMTLGPATGRLLAELIATGTRPAVLEPFDPCR
jgi:D-amino-acid dehydrogenase